LLSLVVRRRRTAMLFAHAGWCEACVATDLLYAKALASERIFFVCAACTAAGVERPTPNLPSWEQSIKDRVQELAPMGWTLATPSEVGGRPVEKEADDFYEELIAWYPGFQFRSRVSAEP
ncbi:MAG TPA: hypothetical protein PKD86_09360, partial [Gemmatales bacterium]|nr:hypothetical protein [Gemmatales bacterium]